MHLVIVSIVIISDVGRMDMENIENQQPESSQAIEPSCIEQTLEVPPSSPIPTSSHK